MSPCIYDRFSPCDGCGHCNKSRFKDDTAECHQCDDVICGGETAYEYDDKTFCSIECIISYLLDIGDAKTVSLDENDEIKCERCDKTLDSEYEVIKFDDKYFCDENCLGEYISELVETRTLWTAEDYEDDYGDMKYHQMKDDGLL